MLDPPKTYGTSNGIEITDGLIEILGDEAEAGYEDHQLTPRKAGRPLIGTEPGEVVPVRLDPELRRLLTDRAQSEATSVSHVIRQALKAFFKVA